ncbi:MAG: IMP dehydrogenase, partial [Spirochaetaceae bacterium]|nr:IMP dehydrogenase [Spirochaetaceae bacterium]
MIELKETFSYDDVLLVPGYSEVLPRDTDVSTVLVKNIRLNVPVISAAMDTVTEEKMAVALALEGGVGVIHRNLPPEEQARQVSHAKRYLNWIIESPVTVMEDATVSDVKELMARFHVSGLPVIDSENRLVGIITGRDLRFCRDDALSVQEIMTKKVV